MSGSLSAEKRESAATQHPQRLQSLLEGLVVVICTLAFLFTSLDMFKAMLGRDAPGTRDFVEYWASGQQLAHHRNPYDIDAILRIERSEGLPSDVPSVVMGNAPSALVLVYPLGFAGARLAEFLWMATLLASLILSVRMIRTFSGAPHNHLHCLGYSFGPALVCLGAGQVSLLVLLGLVLFLRLQKNKPFLAGASLWFCALKPQIFVPFGLALLLWIVITRSYKILAGAVGALGFTTAIAFALDHAVWTHYSQMMAATRLDKLAIPCLSITLRTIVSPGATWLQYLPVTLGSIWALAYFRQHRHHWDWSSNGSLLVLVSVLVAPYTWLVDQAIVIPAILQALYLTRSRGMIALLALASALIEILPLRGFSFLHSNAYLWTAPAWLLWYLVAIRSPKTVADAATDAELFGTGPFPALHETKVTEV
jgi:hypothetical protein